MSPAPASTGTPAPAHTGVLTAFPLLCVVTDRRRFQATDTAAACDAVVRQANEAAEAGLDLFQVREPDLDDRTLLRLVERVRDAVAGSRLRVVVNDRVDIALATGVDGVHLRESSYAAGHARALLGAAAIVGRSVHDAATAQACDARATLDYLIFGTLFPTSSKSPGHPVAGLDALAAVVRGCRRPVLAIGGVTVDNAPAIARSGAAGVAAIGLFLGAQSPGPRAALPLRQAAMSVRLAFTELQPR